MRKLPKRLVDALLIPIVKKASPLGEIVAYISRNIGIDGYDSYNYLKTKFINNGKQSRWDEIIRAQIVERFEIIDREIPVGTTKTDSLFLAEALLSLQADGSVVECGCYAGGSTAKLSVVTKIIGKELFIFDSFEGLPKPDPNNATDYHARISSEWVTDWTAGIYAASLKRVKSNIQKYGEISVCTFYKGWFRDTLNERSLPDKISFAFTDVDIANSARTCLVAIWPRITDGGVYFSHDIAFIKVLQTILEENLWREVFKEYPPILFGAGYGLRDSSPHLGFMVKGKLTTAEYINCLTIDK